MISYDLILAPSKGTYVDLVISPVPASAGTLSVVYKSQDGSTIATHSAGYFSLNSDGIRWSIDPSIDTSANSGLTYQILDGSTVIASGKISVYDANISLYRSYY